MFTIADEFKCLCENAPSRVDEKLEFCVFELIECALKNSLLPGHLAIGGAAVEAMIAYAKGQGVAVPRTESLLPVFAQHLIELGEKSDVPDLQDTQEGQES